ncbi:MAG TPA: DsbA family protein, partial [Caldilineaceae bacterium]|nr:DsbA family protein [Caldilineaceae bacterium]
MPELTVFIDYSCPYVYRAAEWLHTLSSNGAGLPPVRWRFFSLAQVNHRVRDGWQVWDAPTTNPAWQEEDYARGLRYFWAATA